MSAGVSNGCVDRSRPAHPSNRKPAHGTAPLIRCIRFRALVIFLLLPPKPPGKKRTFLLSLEGQRLIGENELGMKDESKLAQQKWAVNRNRWAQRYHPRELGL